MQRFFTLGVLLVAFLALVAVSPNSALADDPPVGPTGSELQQMPPLAEGAIDPNAYECRAGWVVWSSDKKWTIGVILPVGRLSQLPKAPTWKMLLYAGDYFIGGGPLMNNDLLPVQRYTHAAFSFPVNKESVDESYAAFYPYKGQYYRQLVLTVKEYWPPPRDYKPWLARWGGKYKMYLREPSVEIRPSEIPHC